MGRKKQRCRNDGWFSLARRKFLAEVLKHGATLTTIVANLQKIVSGRPPVPVEPVKVTASDRISVNVNESVVVTPGTATASFGTAGPVVVIS
ncbi:MAG TPA: hypothetical protein VET45_14915 [Candidatus Binatia bacterium]|nr:hypothetical protein [Candidatus Binatia bacterium]